jgi:hypothetical protein
VRADQVETLAGRAAGSRQPRQPVVAECGARRDAHNTACTFYIDLDKHQW